MEEQLNLRDLSPEETEKLLLAMRQTGIQWYSPEKPIFNLTIQRFHDILAAQIDLTALYVLQCVYYNHDILKMVPLAKVKGWYQTLQRRGYIGPEGHITETGKQLLDIIGTDNSIKQELTKIEAKQEDGFEKWWSHFPPNDIFEYKGKKFSGQRVLRSDKPKCRVYFDRIINEGEYTIDDMIRALDYEVALKKEASIKEGDNKMRYLSASTAYLNQRKFEGFIEISKTATITSISNSSTQYGGFDI
jgi:hypothetical protein